MPGTAVDVANDGALGERLAIGRTAEVYAWSTDRIIKLLRPGFPEMWGEREAAIAWLVTAARLPAPPFAGVERVDGRFGLVFGRVSGPSMFEELKRRPWSLDSLARRFAAAHAEMHETDGQGLPDYSTGIRHAIERSAEVLGPERLAAVRDRLDRAAPGGRVCHGDYHPGNVLVSGSHTVVIDWMSAGVGPPEADLARTLFLLNESAIPLSYSRAERSLIRMIRRRFAKTYLSAYRRLRRLDEGELARWHVPVLAARAYEGVEGERGRLLASIDAELAATG